MVATQLLMFIPLPLVAGMLAVWSAFRRRMRRRPRVGLLLVAALGLAVGLSEMVGWHGGAAVAPGVPRVTMLHWNVLWGGLKPQRDWPLAIQRIAAAEPDFVVLSADEKRLDELAAALGPAWRYVLWKNEPRQRYTFRLAVLAPDPVTLERRDKLSGGKAMTVRLDRPAGPLRVLVIDGLSDPTSPRLPPHARRCPPRP